MACTTDDDMVVHGDVEQSPGFGDAVGDLDIGAAWLGIAARMVVDDPAVFTIYLIYIVFSDALPKVVPGSGSGV